MRTRPVILHLDLDAFFSAVEQLHKPSLRGKPVVVGGTGRRGVVATASYEARAYAVGSAMPIGEARRRCPNAAYLAPRFGAYQAASRTVMALAKQLSPIVEQVSIDEAYVDLSPTYPQIDVAGVGELAEAFRANLREVSGLSASIGAGTSKLIAKIGSELNKPDGVRVIAPGQEAQTLAPMSVRRLPGVGPATQDRLHKNGFHLIGEVAAASIAELIEILGQAHGSSLHQHARGIDNRLLVPERDAKSVSAETTFPTDLVDQRVLLEQARALVARVSERLAKDGSSARTITLKVRSYDFSTITRSLTLDQPTDSAAKILAGARQLLSAIDTTDGIRLLGVGISGLSEYAQQDLLAQLEVDRLDDEQVGDGEADVGDRQESPGSAHRGDRDGTVPGPAVWTPGQDVVHSERGPGWVQGSGRGLVTVRFEGPHTPPGPIATLSVADPALRPADPPVW